MSTIRRLRVGHFLAKSILAKFVSVFPKLQIIPNWIELEKSYKISKYVRDHHQSYQFMVEFYLLFPFHLYFISFLPSLLCPSLRNSFICNILRVYCKNFYYSRILHLILVHFGFLLPFFILSKPSIYNVVYSQSPPLSVEIIADKF